MLKAILFQTTPRILMGRAALAQAGLPGVHSKTLQHRAARPENPRASFLPARPSRLMHMNRFSKLPLAMFMFTAIIYLSGCTTQILKSIPPDYSIPSGKVVYLENDGRCAEGQVIKITGGKNIQGIERKYECVERPQ